MAQAHPFPTVVPFGGAGLHGEIVVSAFEFSLAHAPPDHELEVFVHKKNPGKVYYCPAHQRLYQKAGSLKSHLAKKDSMPAHRFDLLMALGLIWKDTRPYAPTIPAAAGPVVLAGHLAPDTGSAPGNLDSGAASTSRSPNDRDDDMASLPTTSRDGPLQLEHSFNHFPSPFHSRDWTDLMASNEEAARQVTN